MRLTIGIPTCNRRGSLQEILTNVIEQIEEMPKKSNIELLICDNASEDGTQELAQSILSKFSYVNYHRNARNLGFDGNCESVMKNAVGDHVWLLSDDDSIDEDAVAQVYDMVSRNQTASFCFVNYKIRIGGLTEHSRCSIDVGGALDSNEFIKKSNFAFSFVSSCIINRRKWASVDFSKYIGTNWYHAFVARDLMVGSEVAVIASPIVTMTGLDLVTSRAEKRKTDPGACDFYMEAYLRLFAFALDMPKVGYSIEHTRSCLKIIKRMALRQIIYLKAASERYDLFEITYIIKELSKYNGLSIFHWFVHVPLLIMPSCIVGNLYWKILPLYKKIKPLLRKIQLA